MKEDSQANDPQPIQQPQPAYAPQQPAPQQINIQVAENPGHTLGIVGLVLIFFWYQHRWHHPRRHVA